MTPNPLTKPTAPVIGNSSYFSLFFSVEPEIVSLPEGNTTDIKDRYQVPWDLAGNENLEEAPGELATAKYLRRGR